MAFGCGKSEASSPDLPWKARLLLGVYSFGMNFCRRSDGSVNRRLVSLIDPQSPASPKPKNGVTSTDTTVDSSRSLWFRLYVPVAGESNLPVLIYFHGGGFVFASPGSKSYDTFCSRLAAALPAVVVSVNYRLSPEHRFPAQYDDCYDALKFIDSAAGNNPVLPSRSALHRCFLAGDSAGGNIAHHVALRAAKDKPDKLRIAGTIAIQPFFGGEERTESELRFGGGPPLKLELSDWMWRAFLPEGSDRNHEAANVVSTDVSGLEIPATAVIVGGLDPLQDRQRRYCEWLKKGGKQVKLVEYPDAIHGFYGFPGLPQTDLLLRDVAEFIRMQDAN